MLFAAAVGASPWTTILTIVSVAVAVGSFVWAVVRDRNSNKTEIIDKAINGLDDLVDALQVERAAMQTELATIRTEHQGAVMRERVLGVELDSVRAEVSTLRTRIDSLMRVLSEHGLSAPLFTPTPPPGS